jgi:hypothetical protein
MRSAAYRPTPNLNTAQPAELSATELLGASQPHQDGGTDMRKKIKITLNHQAVVPLRHALYARLAMDVQEIAQVLDDGAPQHSRQALAAFTRLQRTGGLLNRIGWTHDDYRHQITVDQHADLDVAIEALREEAAAESAIRTAALEDKAAEEAERATKRELIVHDILAGLEATRAAATIDSVATTITERPPAA